MWSHGTWVFVISRHCTSGRGEFVRQKYWCEIDNINNCVLLCTKSIILYSIEFGHEANPSNIFQISLSNIFIGIESDWLVWVMWLVWTTVVFKIYCSYWYCQFHINIFFASQILPCQRCWMFEPLNNIQPSLCQTHYWVSQGSSQPSLHLSQPYYCLASVSGSSMYKTLWYSFCLAQSPLWHGTLKNEIY